MNMCAHIEEVEDMVLGILDGPARRGVQRHLATCEECREARDEFEEERALFAARAPEIAAPRELGKSIDTALASEIASRGETRGRVVHGVFAAVACAAALLFTTNLARLHDGARTDASTGIEAPAPQAELASGMRGGASGASGGRESRDEPLACFASSSARSEPVTSDAPRVDSFTQSSHFVSRALCEP
jgi:anti-sigma factor RsiW